MGQATETMAAWPQKLEYISDEDEKIRLPRWTMASFERYLRGVWFRLKLFLLFCLMVYLIRHWFDFFCYPWTFDDILFARRIPWFPSLMIIGGAIAWAWKHQTSVVFWFLCLLAAFVAGSELYLYHYLQHDLATSPRFFATSICTCGTVVLTAVWGHVKLEPKDIGSTPEVRLRQDDEAFDGGKAVDARDEQSQDPIRQSHTSPWSKSRVLFRKLPSTRIVLAVALTAAIATMAVHPPDMAIEHLSAINCEAHAAQLDFDDTHFEFTVTDQNNTFTGRCSEAQQIWALDGIMNAHVGNSNATCGVWCGRKAVSGQLVGYISQVKFGLVDMYYCRGGYGSFGPDCEAEGEEYGYDTSREGWMNDIYEPWSILEEEDGIEPAGADEHPYDDEGQ